MTIRLARAFVIELDEAVGLGHDIRGRAEHVLSGDRLDFETPQQLFAFLGKYAQADS